MRALIVFTIALVLLFGCKQEDGVTLNDSLILGADLSYLNEMLDCGAQYRADGLEVNPYDFFAKKGCQMVRLRLWHSPTFNSYSNLADVKEAALMSNELGMQILLDIHYSDSWADPSKQIVPEAWSTITDVPILSDSVYTYTKGILTELLKSGIIPSIVQIGNEINSEILQEDEAMSDSQINWERNSTLINHGLDAVLDFNKANNQNIATMLHIAQPENVVWWFDQAEANGIVNYDWIGISYYPQWSAVSLDQLENELSTIKSRFEKKVMIVETAYPHTISDADKATNLLGEGSNISRHGISESGQLNYLHELKNAVSASGTEGIIYWEPAWVSTRCETQWAQGSHWDNATFFDASNTNEALIAFAFFKNN